MGKDRWIILGLVGLVLGLCFIAINRFFAASSVHPASAESPITAAIDGDSMAPTLLGEHCAISCPDCRCPLKIAPIAPGLSITCSQCGHTWSPTEQELSFQPAQRISLTPLTPNEPLQRHEVVVITDPTTKPATFQIKRIAALPGETWGTSAGDLIVNGQVVQKTWEQLHEVALPIYTTEYSLPQTTSLPQRWRSDPQAVIAWRLSERASETKHSFQWKTDQPTQEWQWLRYHHWRCVTSPLPRDADAPILDNDAYNSQLSREQNPVTDLLLQISLSASKDARFAVQLGHTRQSFLWECDFASSSQRLTSSDKTLLELPLPKSLSDRPLSFEMAICDQRCMLKINGVPQGEVPYLPLPFDSLLEDPPLPQIALGGMAGEIEVSKIDLQRDLFLTGPKGESIRWTSSALLGNDAFAVLGDNVPVSIDSRQSAPAGIPRASISHRYIHPK